jgi:hypothetical protein
MTREEQALLFLIAAGHALRSYQYGNDSPDLAEEMADSIDEFFEEGRKQAKNELVRQI